MNKQKNKRKANEEETKKKKQREFEFSIQQGPLTLAYNNDSVQRVQYCWLTQSPLQTTEDTRVQLSELLPLVLMDIVLGYCPIWTLMLQSTAEQVSLLLDKKCSFSEEEVSVFPLIHKAWENSFISICRASARQMPMDRFGVRLFSVFLRRQDVLSPLKKILSRGQLSCFLLLDGLRLRITQENATSSSIVSVDLTDTSSSFAQVLYDKETEKE